jgi:predicted ester cyclase
MKEATLRWIKGIFDEGNFDLIEEMTTEDYTFSVPRTEGVVRTALPDMVTGFRTAIPDLHNEIHEQLSEGNVVVTRGTSLGTHQGPFGDLPPTGKPIASDWVLFTRFEGDRIAEDREVWDELSVMTQMGAIPELE